MRQGEYKIRPYVRTQDAVGANLVFARVLILVYAFELVGACANAVAAILPKLQ